MRPLRLLAAALLLAFGLGGTLATGYWLGATRPVVAEGMFTCSMHPQVRNGEPGLCPICRMELVPAAAADGDADDAEGILIDPVMVQNAGVRIHRVARGQLTDELRLSGTLLVAQDRERDVSLKFSGFVEVLHANRNGIAIRKGDPLFELYSPDLIVAEERLIAAFRSGEPAPLQAARLRLERWDVSSATMDALCSDPDATVPRTILWPSPFDGLLVETNVVQGGRIDAGATAMRIADLSTVWLEAQVPESQLPEVQVGMPATIEFQSRPGELVEGRVCLVAPLVDERTRTGSLRIELPNPDGRFLPGMFARVRLQIVRRSNALLLPDEAILETGRRRICWVALGRGKFAPRTLRLGPAGASGETEVLEGVAEGEPVVVSGQLLIDADSRLRENLRKFGAQDLLPPGELPPPTPPAIVDATAQAAVDELYRAYLGVARSLADDRSDDDAWRRLGDAIHAMHGAAEPVVGRLAAAAAAPANDLAARRQAFVAVSDAVVPLLDQLRPTAACGKEILVVHCSMKPASWLQSDREIRNPYYGSEMLACGRIQQVLATATGSER